MKIINLNTNVVFDLPDSEAESLIKNSPDLFAYIGKNNNIILNNHFGPSFNSVLSQILDE